VIDRDPSVSNVSTIAFLLDSY